MPELIPLSVLFGNPERVSPRLSPDGSRLAWIAPHDDVLNVWVAPIGPDGADWAAARVVTDDTDRGIRIFAWAHDGRHLLYAQDKGGDENWRLYDVDLPTMQRRDLTPFDGVQAQLIGVERSRPDEVLLGLNKANPQLHDVYRLHLSTGELVKEIDNPGFIGWVADAGLQVRAAAAPQPDGSYALMVRDTAEADWRELLRIPAEDAESTDVLAFSADGSSLLLATSIDAEASRLVRIELGTGATEVLAEDPEADVSAVRVHPDSREPQIVTFLKARSVYRVLDPSVAEHVEAIRRLHPGDPGFGHGDDDDRVWLAAFTNDAGSVSYFTYDTSAGAASFLFEARPELSRYELAAMEPFSFTARDGLTINGYLTFPPGEDRI
ncbi:MAG TPA: hypothetical protein VEV45_23155, partial [Streptosporangiaceae bacterium]|nr:hypothetical protein [Streptosporangiaceae bacterium]